MRRSEPLETGLGRRPLCRCHHPRFHREGSGHPETTVPYAASGPEALCPAPKTRIAI